MKALILNGSLEKRPESTSGRISRYFAERLEQSGFQTEIFTLADSGIPLLTLPLLKLLWL
jgi:arsenic resistance protein ArsH